MEVAMKGVVSLLVVLAGLASGCRQAPDTEENVRKALDQANMQAVQIEVNEQAGIVHLKGVVPTINDRTRAQEVAAAAVGTTGRVLNELTVKGLNDETADDLDDAVTDALEAAMQRDPVLKERDIDFRVTNGMVAITGEVTSADEKARAEQLARAAPGVK